MGFAGSTFGSKNRTSVLYDFSAVKKAAFYVYKEIKGTKLTKYFLDTGYGGGTGILYAQINPYELKLDVGKKKRRQKTSFKVKGSVDDEIDADLHRTLSMELIYDVYDEHMVGTLDGMLTGVQNIDLTQENLTSLPDLVRLARQIDKCVLFKWGSTEFFGKVDSVDFTYKAFSRFGYPLKAVGNVTLKSVGDKLDGAGNVKNFLDDTTDTTSASVKAQARGGDMLDTAALYAEIGATQALR